MPESPGVALVLIQHLDPTHESLLSEILQRESKMPVAEATNGMLIEVDHVYVMPPNVAMELSGGALKLTPRKAAPAEQLPIDRFFRSLATQCGSHAVGVLLSGTGSDGARGLVAIKEAGGVALVQDPLTADYDGMPRAAIGAGAADAVLDPAHIARRIVLLARRLNGGGALPEEGADAVDEAGLDTILKLIRIAKGLDLTDYRRTTLLRRISRRMLLGGYDTMEAYLRWLRNDEAEVNELYRDMLVNVTEFFRDPPALDALVKEAFPAVLRRKVPEAAFRLWVPGCSTGQEAYSIAILLFEFLETARVPLNIQMFASDVNEDDVKFARTGVYPEDIAREMSPERLARFFTQVPGGYRVEQSIREMCVFAVHDVTNDPPFSRLDVVSFRNVLIYMERPLQKRALQVLHYALVPGGYLLLGPSETIGGETALFSAADKKHRLYARKPGPARLLPPAGSASAPRKPEKRSAREEEEQEPPSFDVLREAEKVVLDAYTPPGVVVNEALEILQFRGKVAPFLDPLEGPPSLTLPKLLGTGVASSARTAIREAAKTGGPARRAGFLTERDGTRTQITVEAVPITGPRGERYYLVLLEAPSSVTVTARATSAKRRTAPVDSAEVARLRTELAETREYLENLIADKDAVNLDLGTTADKLQTGNEELRTINEEFQTAQEELQSTNEELTTLNDELRNRNTELGQLTDDLDNVIRGVEIPILILGPDLSIHRVTPQADQIINIAPSDVGRQVTDFTFKVEVPDFAGAVQHVVSTLEPSDTDVRGADGHWYSMRIRPYKTGRGMVDGVVVAFVDVDLLKRTMVTAEAAREHAEGLVRTMREPLLTLDSNLLVLEANTAFYESFGASAKETIGTHLYELGNGQWDIAELRSLLGQVLPGDTEFANLEVEHEFPGIGRRVMVLSARRVREEHGFPSILLAIDDVTVQRRRARADAALNEIGLKIGSTLDLEDVLEETLALSASAVLAGSATVMLRQHDGWLVKAVFGPQVPTMGRLLADSDVPLSMLSTEGEDPVLVTDVSADERFVDSVLTQLGHHCILVVPLLLRHETIGSVSFLHLSDGEEFTPADVEFAKRLGTLLSLAFQNASLYATQRRIAETLQTALLTPPVELKDIDFGYLYRSATTAASVGGDLYDLLELSDGRVGVLIGDVSGKGVDAATLAGLVKNTIRALSFDARSPAAVISKTNEVIFRATPASVFVTLLFGILDTESGRLVYCSAGHTRGLIRRANGTGDVEVLDVQSPLAGAFPEVAYVDGEASLARGDALILYTDGVTEARRRARMLGEDGLVKMVRRLGATPTAEIPDAIFAEVLSYSGDRLADDVAIISVGRTPDASHAPHAETGTSRTSGRA